MPPHRGHILHTNHRTGVPLMMVWVDCEAANEQGIGGPGEQRLTFGWACLQVYENTYSLKPKYEPEWFRFTTPEQFWGWLTSKCVVGKRVWVMAHNWNYDAGILDTSNQLPAMGWELKQYINGKPPLIVKWVKSSGVSTDHRPYLKKDGTISIRGYEDKFSFQMIDTLNYFTGSAANLGEAVGLAKLPMPQPGDPQSEWDTYCKRDVGVIREAFLKLREFVRENDLGTMQPTLASQAMAAYRHRFMPTQILIHDHPDALDLEREAYHGGRTEAFWHGPIDEHLYKLDINSMYPAIMHDALLPCWFEKYFPTFDALGWEKSLVDRSIVARVKIKTDEPVYGARRENKLIFPVGSFETVLTTPEIHYAIEHGHLVDVLEFAVYRRANLFKAFVDYFYEKRQEYKEAGNQAFQYMCKILMNTLYGKWGQSGHRWEDTKEYQWEGFESGLTQNDDGKIIHLRNRLGQTQILSHEGETMNSFPLIAAEITALARLQLWELVKEAGEDHVYYTDTDSLVVDASGYNNLANRIHPTRLGALKLEEESTSSEFLAPKHYTFNAKTVLKGVRRNAVQVANIGDATKLLERLESLETLLWEATESLAGLRSGGDTPPHFGSSERTEWEVQHRGRKSKGQQTKEAQARVAQLRGELRAAKLEYKDAVNPRYQQEVFRSWDYNLSIGVDGHIIVSPIIKSITGANTKRIVCGVGFTKPLVLAE